MNVEDVSAALGADICSNVLVELEGVVRVLNIPYMDGIIELCHRKGYEIEHIATLVKKDPVLKAKIQAEAESLNFLKRTARLDKFVS
jgi:hypothetical protein